MKWIESNGGPLILVPRSLLRHWCGVNPDSPMIGDDYEKACAIKRYLGRVGFAGGTALVLGDAPDRTTMMMSELGPAILRWWCADSEAAMLASFQGCLNQSKIIEEANHTFSERVHVLFDSAYSGEDFEDALELELDPGDYQVTTRHYQGNRVEFLAHVFGKR